MTALHNPSANLSTAAFSQIPRDRYSLSAADPLIHVVFHSFVNIWSHCFRLIQGMSGAGPGPHEQFMGYSIRTSEWRYTEWRKFASDLPPVLVVFNQRDPEPNSFRKPARDQAPISLNRWTNSVRRYVKPPCSLHKLQFWGSMLKACLCVQIRSILTPVSSQAILR